METRDCKMVLRGQALEVDAADVTQIIFDNEEIALAVHRDGAKLAEFVDRWRIKPLAVARVDVAVAVDHDVNEAGLVHVEKLGASICRQEIAANGRCQTPRTCSRLLVTARVLSTTSPVSPLP